MNVSKYKTAVASSAKDLDKEVNKLIQEGYTPYGSPYVSDTELQGKDDTFAMFQAMVITDETARKLRAVDVERRLRKEPRRQ
jgi:hypothetical protein